MESCEVKQAQIVVVGAGAAGLMAAIWAARTFEEHEVTLAEDRRPDGMNKVLLLDSAKMLGAKILVSGGGRCNVTHDVVDESAYAGSTPSAIKKVLRSFDVSRTIEFFREIGVELKREETGKLFPVTDSARTVLNALLDEARRLGVTIQHPWRVESVQMNERNGGWVIWPTQAEIGGGVESAIQANFVILAMGGKSLPKTGSDGHGYQIARELGHSITSRIFPALVPLLLDRERTFLHRLSGVAVRAELLLSSGTGKRLKSFTNSVLFTHFGLSGPCVLDISRYWTDAYLDDPQVTLSMNLAPGQTFEQVDALLMAGSGTGGKSVTRCVVERLGLPESLARALVEFAGLEAGAAVHAISREARRRLAHAITGLELPVVGDRGFVHAEVTAGGVPLAELNLATMQSRLQQRLAICGELCDVDGRIGGFNFQWAWASGRLAGIGAAQAVLADSMQQPS